MTPRIPLPSDKLNRLGLPDTGGMAPALSAARRRFHRTTQKMDAVDPVTTELVRIRNARYQNCYF